MEPVVIGVAGGTGSGKTTVAHEVLKRAGTKKISLIQHDAYYKNLDDLPWRRGRCTTLTIQTPWTMAS